MDHSALQQVRRRLDKAKKAFETLRHAPDQRAIDAWSDFLSAANTIYAKLKKGAENHPTSEHWFGRQKHIRDNDPLLVYIHQARNVDEHGIKEVTQPDPCGSVGASEPLTFWGIQPEWNELACRWVATGPPGGCTTIFPLDLWLRPVTNRGVIFEPPATHLGNPVPMATAYWVAKLGVEYLERLVQEAESLSL